MSFQQKNNAVSLVSFLLLLIYFVLRNAQLIVNQQFNHGTVVRLWVIVVVLAIFGTLVAIIFAQGIPAEIVRAGKTGGEPEIDDFVDERDEQIDLEGTNLTYKITSFGTFVASLTFVFGYSPLIMFTLMMLFGLVGQIAGDTLRLKRYRGE